MKTFFLILLLVKSPNEIIYVKVPFSYSVEPITCEEIYYEKVKHKFFENDGYYGFLANPNDVEEHGRQIFEKAKAGDYGTVGDYVEPKGE